MTTDTIFTFSTETLADATARGMMRPPDRFLLTLAHSDRVGQLLVVDAPRWVGAIIRRGRSAWPEILGPRRPHLRPIRLARREPSDLDGVARHVENQETQLRRRARRLGLQAPAIVTFDPLLAGFGDFDWAGPITFYARDDWASFPPRRPWWPAYAAAFARIRERKHGVLAVSEPLMERLSPTGPHAVIRNGIAPDEWAAPAAPPAWFTALPRPIHTYVGTVDERIDLELITAAAQLEGTVLLVGPTDPATEQAAVAAGAVHRIAADRAELAAIVMASDTGLVPHRATDLTEAMCPLKLYEYRAAGRPVATVSLPPIAAEAVEDDGIILADDGPSAYAAAIEAALRRGPDAEADRQRYVSRASWAGRHEPALDIALRHEAPDDGFADVR